MIFADKNESAHPPSSLQEYKVIHKGRKGTLDFCLEMVLCELPMDEKNGIRIYSVEEGTMKTNSTLFLSDKQLEEDPAKLVAFIREWKKASK